MTAGNCVSTRPSLLVARPTTLPRNGTGWMFRLLISNTLKTSRFRSLSGTLWFWLVSDWSKLQNISRARNTQVHSKLPSPPGRHGTKTVDLFDAVDVSQVGLFSQLLYCRRIWWNGDHFFDLHVNFICVGLFVWAAIFEQAKLAGKENCLLW